MADKDKSEGGIPGGGKTSIRSVIQHFNIVGGVFAFTYRGDKLKPYSFTLVNIGTTSINHQGRQILPPSTANNITQIHFPVVLDKKRNDILEFAFSGAGVAAAYIVSNLEIEG